MPERQFDDLYGFLSRVKTKREADISNVFKQVAPYIAAQAEVQRKKEVDANQLSQERQFAQTQMKASGVPDYLIETYMNDLNTKNLAPGQINTVLKTYTSPFEDAKNLLPDYQKEFATRMNDRTKNENPSLVLQELQGKQKEYELQQNIKIHQEANKTDPDQVAKEKLGSEAYKKYLKAVLPDGSNKFQALNDAMQWESDQVLSKRESIKDNGSGSGGGYTDKDLKKLEKDAKMLGSDPDMGYPKFQERTQAGEDPYVVLSDLRKAQADAKKNPPASQETANRKKAQETYKALALKLPSDQKEKYDKYYEETGDSFQSYQLATKKSNKKTAKDIIKGKVESIDDIAKKYPGAKVQ